MDPQKRSTEELILEAAQAVFLEKGLAGARMQEIADRAGINKALLHYYFRSKEKLSAIIISRTIGVIMPRMMGVLATDQDLFDKIRELVNTFIGFISRNSFLPLFVVNEVNRNPHFFFTSAIQQDRTYIDKFRQHPSHQRHAAPDEHDVDADISFSGQAGFSRGFGPFRRRVSAGNAASAHGGGRIHHPVDSGLIFFCPLVNQVVKSYG
jgi:AcrR family transcriptional regulator